MTRIAPALLALMIAAVPARGEEPAASAEEGFSLLEEGARIILRSLVEEMEPALKEMQEGLGDAMKEMGPVLRELAAMIGDIRNYEMPEKLPNGDIILRRKVPPAPEGPGTLPGPDGQIDI